MKSYNTLKSLLVHPKDKQDINQTCGVIYDIHCKECKKAYIGEKGGAFGSRLKEHQEDSEKLKTKEIHAGTNRKELLREINKSAITNHIAQEHHVVLEREENVIKRRIQEGKPDQK